MKKAINFIVSLLLGFTCLAQTGSVSPVKILSVPETNRIINEQVKRTFAINMHIFRTYSFADRSGQYYTILTESDDKIDDKDTTSTRIRAITLKSTPAGLVKQWEMNDFVVKNPVNKEMESAIWFWTKYCSFTDIDHDGLIDPILVYGTYGMNGFDDGRIKILTWYKGHKAAWRFQNGVLDDERSLDTDAAFSELPKAIKDHISAIDTKIYKAQHEKPEQN